MKLDDILKSPEFITKVREEQDRRFTEWVTDTPQPKKEEKQMQRECRICGIVLGPTINQHPDVRGFMLCEWCYRNVPGAIVMVAANEKNKTVIDGMCYRTDNWKTHPKVAERLSLVNPELLQPFSNEEFTAAYREFCKDYGEDAVSHYIVACEHAITPEVEEALFHSVSRSSSTLLNVIEVAGKHGEWVMWTRGEEPTKEEPQYIFTSVPVFEDTDNNLFIVPPPPGSEWEKVDVRGVHPPPYLMGYEEVHDGILLYMGSVEDVSHSSNPKPVIEAQEFKLGIAHENGLIELQEWVRRGVAEQWKCNYVETWRKQVVPTLDVGIVHEPGILRELSMEVHLPVQGQWDTNHPSGPVKREEESSH